MLTMRDEDPMLARRFDLIANRANPFGSADLIIGPSLGLVR